MEIQRSNARRSTTGAADWFTGEVQVEPLFKQKPPGRVQGAIVTFQPGARTAWHAHPAGQVLYVLAGRGFVQSWGGTAQEIQAGDVVTCPPNEKHCHGAAPESSMAHLAIQEELDGQVVKWMEKVSDEQYAVATRAKYAAR
jgi:quercetin dioxygenase-like cupin family protein